MTVSRYGNLRSAPVVVDAGLRTEWGPPTLRAPLWDSTRFLDGFSASPRPANASGGRHGPGHRDVFFVQAPNFAIVAM